MKIIHAWDIQVGRGYPEYPDLADRLREHRFEILRNLVARATRERANALILGGNTLADNRITDHEVAELTDLLTASAIPVFILPGPLDPFTPDSPYRLQSELWEGSVTILGEKRPYSGKGFTIYPFPVTTRDQSAPQPPTENQHRLPPPTSAKQKFQIAVACYEMQPIGERMEPVSATSSFDYVASRGQTLLPGDLWAAEDPVGARLVTLSADSSPTVDRLAIGRLRKVVLKIRFGEVDDPRRSLEEVEHPADTILHVELLGSLPIDRMEDLRQMMDRWRRKVLHLELREHFTIEGEAELTFAHPLIRATAERLAHLAMVAPDSGPEDLPSDSEAARWALFSLTKLLREAPHREFASWK
jgi:hypothetical protein